MKITIASGKGVQERLPSVPTVTSYIASQGNNIVLADLDVEEPNSALFLKAKLKKTNISNKMVPLWGKKIAHSVENVQKFVTLIQ